MRWRASAAKLKMFFGAVAFAAALACRTGCAYAEDYVLTLKDHQFNPQGLSIPSYTQATIVVRNLDPTAAEIGSNGLKIESELVEANGELRLDIGRVAPGYYDLFDAFHNDTDCVIEVRKFGDTP